MKDANGQQIAYLYFEDEPQRQMIYAGRTQDARDLVVQKTPFPRRLTC